MSDQSKYPSKPSFSQIWAYRLDTTKAGRIWDTIDVVLTFLFCIVYVINSLYIAVPDHIEIPLFFYYLDISLAIIILLQWLPRILFARSLFQRIFSLYGISTIMACIPILVGAIFYHAFQQSKTFNFYGHAGVFVYFYPLRFLRLHVCISRCLVPAQQGLVYLTLIQRKGLNLSFALISTLLAVAGYIHIIYHVENGKLISDPKITKPMSFFDAFYAVTVSCTFGLQTSIVPDGAAFRTLILYTMLAFTLYVPTRLSELLSLISKKSKYDRQFVPLPDNSHIIVCGQLYLAALQEFLREFFCSDHGENTMRTQVVLLGWEEPNEELVAMLDDPVYHNRVKYIKGMATKFGDLKKARADSAEACFVMSDTFSIEDPSQDDAECVMRSLALKKFNPNLKLFVEVVLPENESHFDFLADETVCIDKIKLGILSQSCLNPGFATLIHLLTTSVTQKTCNDILRQIQKKPELSWVEDYLYGTGQEIYPFPIPDCFQGKTMSYVSARIYEQFGACLFAIGLDKRFSPFTVNSSFTSTSSDSDYLGDFQACLNLFDPKHVSVHLNPGKNYKLTGKEIGFVICGDSKLAEKIFYFPWNSPQADVSEEAQETDPLLQLSPLSGRKGSQKNILDQLFKESDEEEGSILESSSQQGEASASSAAMDPNLAIGVLAKLTEIKALHWGKKQGARLISKGEELLSLGETVIQDKGLSESTSSFHSIALPSAATPSPAMASAETPPNANKLLHPSNTGVGILTAVNDKQPTIISQVAIPEVTNKGATIAETIIENVKGEAEHDIHVLGDDSLPSRIRNHIILCCNIFPRNLESFIAPIRAANPIKATGTTVLATPNPKSSTANLQPTSNASKNPQPLASVTPVVILCPHDKDDREWKRLTNRYSEIYYVKGSVLARKDLVRVGVDKAARAVVLTDIGRFTNKERLSRLTADSNTLLALLNLEMMLDPNRDTFIVGELVHKENFKYVGGSNIVQTRENHAKSIMRPCFMGGKVFAASMLDTIACQAYYNPYSIRLIKQLIFPPELVITSQMERKRKPKFIGPPTMRQFKKAEPKPDDDGVLKTLKDGRLFQMEIPESFATQYHNAIPLGLYRCGYGNGQPIPYVFINPFCQALVSTGDKVFMVAEKKPKF